MFSRGRPLTDFSICNYKDFPAEAKCDEISFFFLEIMKTTFFAKSAIEKCEISTSRAPRLPPFNANACG